MIAEEQDEFAPLVRLEAAVHFFAHQLEGVVGGHRALVGSVRRERVEHVDEARDPGEGVDVETVPARRIARSVAFFVVLMDDRVDGLGESA